MKIEQIITYTHKRINASGLVKPRGIFYPKLTACLIYLWSKNITCLGGFWDGNTEVSICCIEFCLLYSSIINWEISSSNASFCILNSSELSADIGPRL